MFYNAAEFALIYPEDGPADWEPYAALLAEGERALPEIRARLLARAAALGRISYDPDLHLVVDGKIVRGHSEEGRTARFTLPGRSVVLGICDLSSE